MDPFERRPVLLEPLRAPRPLRARATHAASKRRLGLSAAAAACFFVLSLGHLVHTGCSRKDTAAPGTRPPIILFAIDGLEWRLLKPLLEKGELPVMEGLMKKGTYGYLKSLQPTFSPVIWTSIATGKAPSKHGILDFVYESSVKGKKQYRTYTSGHRKTKAFWNIFSDYGLVVDCIGWWTTYPAEPINGVMVSQTNTTGRLRNPEEALWKGTLLKGVDGQVYPPERQNRVMAVLDEVDGDLDRITEGIFGRIPNPTDEFSRTMWDQTLWAFRADATYVRVAHDILEEGQPFDLFALYIDGTDVAAHRFWQYAHPEQFTHPPDAKQIENFGHVIDDEYKYADRVIGQMLALAPPDAGVLIISDHGMRAINRDTVFRTDNPALETMSAHHLDAPPGVIIAAGGPFRSAPAPAGSATAIDLEALMPVGSVLDILPTILAAKGIPIGKDMDGSPIRSIIDFEKLGGNEIRYIPTHDTKEWLAAQPERIREATDDSERLEQLRSLGYIR